MSAAPSNMVTIVMGGKPYKLAVPSSDETKVKALAARVDMLLSDLRTADPTMDRDQMWALVALQLASQAGEATDDADEQGQSVMRFHRELALRLENLLP